jgi:hypothetical protein
MMMDKDDRPSKCKCKISSSELLRMESECVCGGGGFAFVFICVHKLILLLQTCRLHFGSDIFQHVFVGHLTL